MYNSIDDAVVPEIDAKLPEDVKKEKHYNPFYSPLTNLGLIAVLLFTGCVAAPRASAKDTKQSYGTEQVQNKIAGYNVEDLILLVENEYVKVYRTEGSREPRHDPNKKTKPDWHTTPTKFYDFVIQNIGDIGFKLIELRSKFTATGKIIKADEDFLNKVLDKQYLKPNDELVMKDRSFWSTASYDSVTETWKIRNDKNAFVTFSYSINYFP